MILHEHMVGLWAPIFCTSIHFPLSWLNLFSPRTSMCLASNVYSTDILQHMYIGHTESRLTIEKAHWPFTLHYKLVYVLLLLIFLLMLSKISPFKVWKSYPITCPHFFQACSNFFHHIHQWFSHLFKNLIIKCFWNIVKNRVTFLCILNYNLLQNMGGVFIICRKASSFTSLLSFLFPMHMDKLVL